MNKSVFPIVLTALESIFADASESRLWKAASSSRIRLSAHKERGFLITSITKLYPKERGLYTPKKPEYYDND